MGRRLLSLLAAVVLFATFCSVYGETEDEIIARYLKKADKQQKSRIGYISGQFSYGKLSDNIGYRTFGFSATSELASIDGIAHPAEGIFRSKEMSLKLGMMLAPWGALKLGFDYWLPMGSDVSVDYNAIVGVLELQDTYKVKSTVNVYGFNAGFDYYFINPPNEYGVLDGLSLNAGIGGGIYMANWDLWQETSEDFEPLKATAPGFWGKFGIEYPVGLFGLTLGADAEYFFLNFTNITSYNKMSGDLELIYPGDGSKVQLDLSGPRGQIELKRYFRW
jgi:hypothetical protein